MQANGIPWNRDIVANLESGRRASFDVAELVALAGIFDVQPAVLLEGGAVTVTL
jgi:hypothetical protein